MAAPAFVALRLPEGPSDLAHKLYAKHRRQIRRQKTRKLPTEPVHGIHVNLNGLSYDQLVYVIRKHEDAINAYEAALREAAHTIQNQIPKADLRVLLEVYRLHHIKGLSYKDTAKGLNNANEKARLRNREIPFKPGRGAARFTDRSVYVKFKRATGAWPRTGRKKAHTG